MAEDRTQPRPNPFALPQGVAGSLAGRLMAWTNGTAQREAAAHLDLRPGQRVLEIGFGPGRLIRLLSTASPAAAITGVDRSEVMLGQARRANRAAIRAGRVDLRLGQAEDLPFPDGSFDRVVAVHNLPLWTDRLAGLREVHRVLRDGGRIVVAWHGGAAPSRVKRHLVLPDRDLDRIRDDIARCFHDVRRHDHRHTVVFTASR
ncbi:MAG TPA: methyltransferase domain-containing protein [Streptosporangiaceae bacterium]|jgi:SAM-dependent methyltransferase